MKHIDKGVVYIPIDNNTSKEELNKIIEENKPNGHTIVFLRNGKYDIKNVLKELIKATINS